MALRNAEVRILGREQVEIDPEQLVSEAIQFKQNADYFSAEKAYINAINSTMGKTQYVSTTRSAKMGLSNLYSAWGKALFCSGKYSAAEVQLIKSLSIDREMGVDIFSEDFLDIDFLCRVQYKYNTDEKNRLADNLYYLNKENRAMERIMIIALFVIGFFSLLKIGDLSTLMAIAFLAYYIFVAYLKQIYNRGNYNDFWLGLSRNVWIKIAVITLVYVLMAEISSIISGIFLILWGIVKCLHFLTCLDGQDLLYEMINNPRILFKCKKCDGELIASEKIGSVITCPYCGEEIYISNEMSDPNLFNI